MSVVTTAGGPAPQTPRGLSGKMKGVVDSEVALSECVAGLSGPVRIVGGATRSFGSGTAGDVLSVVGLSGITLHDAGALTLVARAGTRLTEIEAALDDAGQRLAFEPMDMRGLLGCEGEPTIGGIVAANASGPRRVQVGACRDFLLGVRFVDGMGNIVSNGGRVMKNVTGYDLVKLFCGSYGSLGVMSEVSLKVLPKPEAVASVVFSGLSDAEAVAAMSGALGSPYEVSGAAHDAQAGKTMLRLEGFDASVVYRAGELTRLLARFGAAVTEQDPKANHALWRAVRDAETMGAQGDVWRISAKPGDAPVLAAETGADALLYDWGGGLIWARVAKGTDLRARLGAYDGHATRVRGTGDAPVFQPQAPGIARLSAGLKARFDPKGLFNPGGLL